MSDIAWTKDRWLRERYPSGPNRENELRWVYCYCGASITQIWVAGSHFPAMNPREVQCPKCKKTWTLAYDGAVK